MAREPSVENIAAFRVIFDGWHESGGRLGDTVSLYYLASALVATGDAFGAEAALQEALSIVEQSGERMFLVELHRLEGQIALRRSGLDPARAEGFFLRALEVARIQAARVFELRAATDLARLWRETGSPNDPRALLEPILAAIEGGEDTRDVRAARALLAEMG